MFCFFLLIQGSSLPSPFLQKKSSTHRHLIFSLQMPHLKLMACYNLKKKKKSCSQLLKKCSQRRRFVVVPFRKMTICQVNRRATFFKIVIFFSSHVYIYRFQIYEEAYMKNVLNPFFHVYCTYTQILEVTFDIFVPRTGLPLNFCSFQFGIFSVFLTSFNFLLPHSTCC